MAITFDASTKRIILDSSSVTAAEIYSRWIDWSAISDNAKYGTVVRQVGGDDLGGGISVPFYFFLQGSWRVRPMESSHALIITGNLFVEGGGIPVVQTLGNFNVSVQYTVPVQAQAVATGGGSDPSVIAAAVWGHSSAASLLDKIDIAQAILRNKTITDPVTGMMTVYAEDGVTPILSASLFENASGSTPYRGMGSERRERLE